MKIIQLIKGKNICRRCSRHIESQGFQNTGLCKDCYKEETCRAIDESTMACQHKIAMYQKEIKTNLSMRHITEML